MEKMTLICRRLWLHSAIQKMPDRYNTVLIDGGRQLSSGLRQKICLARAFYHAGDWLLLDEPTNNLDQQSVEAVLQLCVEFKLRGVGLVVATHDDRWQKIADEVVTLVDGVANVAQIKITNSTRRLDSVVAADFIA